MNACDFLSSFREEGRSGRTWQLGHLEHCGSWQCWFNVMLNVKIYVGFQIIFFGMSSFRYICICMYVHIYIYKYVYFTVSFFAWQMLEFRLNHQKIIKKWFTDTFNWSVKIDNHHREHFISNRKNNGFVSTIDHLWRFINI